MNIQNISALEEQLQSLGFGDWGYQLLKQISFRPKNFYRVYKTEKGKDRLSFEIFFEKKGQDDMYALVYYDAILQQELILSDTSVNGINPGSLEKQMAAIDWKKAFDLEEKKSWNVEDKSSWEKEQKIETVMASLEALETTDEGKLLATSLKLKYWNGSPYYELFGNINVQKNKADISQRFIFLKARMELLLMRRIVFYRIADWKNKCRQEKSRQIIKLKKQQKKVEMIRVVGYLKKDA